MMLRRIQAPTKKRRTKHDQESDEEFELDNIESHKRSNVKRPIDQGAKRQLDFLSRRRCKQSSVSNTHNHMNSTTGCLIEIAGLIENPFFHNQ